MCIYFQLKNKLRMVPSKLLKTEKDLDEYRTKYDAMMQLKPLKENVSLIRCTCWITYAETMNCWITYAETATHVIEELYCCL